MVYWSAIWQSARAAFGLGSSASRLSVIREQPSHLSNQPSANRLLDSLPERELAAITPSLHSVSFALREVVYEQDALISHIYFPINSVLSVLTIMSDGNAIEVGSIGHEGLSGSQVFFGADRPQSQMICQIAGNAQCMKVEDFRKHLEKAPRFRALVYRYTENMFNFMAQSIACNRLHDVNERCARWLLLTQDRVGGDEFFLTQEFLAIMLGTNRPAVTLAAGALQQAGMIEYARGHIKILDR